MHQHNLIITTIYNSREVGNIIDSNPLVMANKISHKWKWNILLMDVRVGAFAQLQNVCALRGGDGDAFSIIFPTTIISTHLLLLEKLLDCQRCDDSWGLHIFGIYDVDWLNNYLSIWKFMYKPFQLNYNLFLLFYRPAELPVENWLMHQIKLWSQKRKSGIWNLWLLMIKGTCFRRRKLGSEQGNFTIQFISCVDCSLISPIT